MLRLRHCFLILLMLCAGLPTTAAIAEEAPLAYQRGALRILRQADTDSGMMPWQQEASGPAFQVEIRSAEQLKSPGWFNLSEYGEQNGLLLALAKPGQISIAPVNQFAPVDIFLINEYGEIEQIMPNLVLADLSSAQISDMPVLAALYTKGGTAERLGIQPGDRTLHPMFKKRPVVLRNTKSANAPKAQATPKLPEVAITPKDNQRKPDANTTNTNAKSSAKYPVQIDHPKPEQNDELIDKILRQNGEIP